jgi:hypothetical protein
MATECKSLRTLLNANGADLSALTTTQKVSLVAAINELKTALDALGTPITISDSTSSTTQVWSSSKVASEITAAKNALTSGAAAALDTLSELDDHTCVVDDVLSLIVIGVPSASKAVFSSLMAATSDTFCVVVSADKSAPLAFNNVRSDLHSVAIRVAKSDILTISVDMAATLN